MEVYMDHLKDYEDKLKKETDKLNRLINRALSGPIAKNEEIIEQRKKVDILIEKTKGGDIDL